MRIPWEIPHSVGSLLLSLTMPVFALALGRAWLRSTEEDGVSPCVCWRHVGKCAPIQSACELMGLEEVDL